MRPHHKLTGSSRRKFIKAVGAGGIAGLAGCGGDGGGDKPTNQDAESSGDSGGTTTGGKGELTTVVIEKTAAGPEAPPYIWALNNGVLFRKGREAGYDFQVKQTWKGPSLFASGQLDVAMMAGFESILMAQERDMELSLVAGIARSGSGALTREGGPYDPAKTGGPKASIDKLVEENGTFAHFAWSGGYIPPTRLIIESIYGHKFSQEESSFPVQVVPLATLAPHAAEGNVDMSLTGPGLGGQVAKKLKNDVLTPVFWIPNVLKAEGFGTPPTSKGVVTRRSFAKEHPDAVNAIVETWQEGVDWMYNNKQEIISNPAYRDVWGGVSEANAEWMWEWAFDMQSPEQDLDLTVPVVREQPGYDKQAKAKHEKFLNEVAALGFVPENWKDYLNIVTTQ